MKYEASGTHGDGAVGQNALGSIAGHAFQISDESSDAKGSTLTLTMRES
jgi:hypothetical protein